MPDKKKEPTNDNQILTGSDKPFSVEQGVNAMKSPEYHKLQREKIKAITNAPNKFTTAAEQKHQLNVAISRIPDVNGGALMRKVLSCRVAGYSYKKMAKFLRKVFDPTASLEKVIKAIKAVEQEGIRRVQAALSTGRIVVPDKLN